MKRTGKTKKIISILFFSFSIFFGLKALAFFSDSNKNDIDFEDSQKEVRVNDNGSVFLVRSEKNTIKDLFLEKGISLGDHDKVTPEIDQRLFPGTNISIERAVKVKIEADGKTQEDYFLAKNVAEALWQGGITLSRLDKVSPEARFPLSSGQKIIVTRINEEEKVIPEEIDFKVTVKKDAKMGWREKIVEQPGEKGIKEVKYKITYKNGKEISRVALSKEITKEPVEQIETQGTFVKTGNAQKGQGTWYSFKGGLYAASLTIPRGGFAKVTNTANGKSVIVEINDSGPYGKGRIIDLDKVAFQKIASLGAGVIGVKVEEVLN